MGGGTIGLRGRETYPPALPKWEGSLSVDDFIDFPLQRNIVSRGLSFSPVGDIVPERSEW
jgi:hypothetical protein